MKKLIFTGLLGLGLLLPYNLFAYNSTSVFAKEFSSKKPKKSKTSKKSRSKKSSSSRTFTSSGKGCSYNGQQLYVGSRGGCYYYSGSNKQYVDRSYCASCN